MKKTHLFAIILCFFAASCDKGNDPAPTPSSEVYMGYAPGNVWTYEETNNTPPASSATYTLNSTNKPDTVVNGNPYHIFTRSSDGASEYYYKNGENYYSFRSLPSSVGGANIESLYLKSNVAVNTTWSEVVSLNTPLGPVNITMNYTIKEKGISKSVNNTNYNNVIHVSGTLSAPPPFNTGLTSDIHWYYAPKYGLIQNETKIDHSAASIHVDTNMKLKSANF